MGNRPMALGLRTLRVRPAPLAPGRAILLAGGLRLDCAVGVRGFAAAKREGDGRTPRGAFRLLDLWHRDRAPKVACALSAKAIRADDGWCDDPGHRAYNRPVRLPFAGGHEALAREDGVYDLLVTLDHNRRPRVRGAGSAIFFHLARPGYPGTAGCVALAGADMRRLLPRLARGARIVIG
ncbi:MAG: L,D-transpeptidase family protein [Hyphomicrobiales bacterium]|nr:L,D-transpeptidase family protein [Hyphomicrobiales bacterium]MDE2016512.1 L,D-transpeptidase family protein [Hyphomicrobiales bacterium]